MENCNNCQNDNCRFKHTRRSEKEIKDITSRINRIQGQLSGVKKMIDENRYCTDILIQVSAIHHAIKSLAGVILDQHLNSCVVEQIKNDNTEVLKELSDFLKKF